MAHALFAEGWFACNPRCDDCRRRSDDNQKRHLLGDKNPKVAWRFMRRHEDQEKRIHPEKTKTRPPWAMAEQSAAALHAAAALRDYHVCVSRVCGAPDALLVVPCMSPSFPLQLPTLRGSSAPRATCVLGSAAVLSALLASPAREALEAAHPVSLHAHSPVLSGAGRGALLVQVSPRLTYQTISGVNGPLVRTTL